MSSSSCSNRRRERAEPAPPAAPAAPAKDWAALPRRIVLDVFLRLGPREVMLGAEFTCKPWRSVALEEPALWRRVGMDPWEPFDKRWRCGGDRAERDMKLVAVDRAKGQCEEFKGYCDDDDLLDLVGRAPSLKVLHIEHRSDYDSGEDLVEALKKLTLLEDLEIDFKYTIYWDENMLESVCEACPHLKKLVLLYASCFDLECNEDEYEKEPIDGAIPVMSKLHTLALYDCELSTKGLKAILDSCPLLENLHIDGYFNKCKMDKELRMKCAKIKNLTMDTKKKPRNSYFDY
ncbi:unnamed protein product [Urochloa decumbens]|uniref:F-box domain-containing protein n=1 Tax=Urochloa decumbens TaxID=240449 RepID=A0ABC9BVG7_9POAL